MVFKHREFTIRYAAFLHVFSFILFASWLAAAEVQPKNEKPHIVFLISEDPDNYDAPRTIPVFAESLIRDHRFKVTVLLGEGERTAFHFPGLEVLSQADLVVVFCRRVALSDEQLAMVKEYLKQGKPLVGIRTAHHAFSALGNIKEGHQAWPEFPAEILGCENRGYGPQDAGTDVAIVREQRKHPILKGFVPSQWHAEGSIYHVAPLLDKKAVVLITGKRNDKTEPVAWTRYTAQYNRVFYTSLGYPSDFEQSQFKNLLTNGIYWALNLEIPDP